MCTYIVNVKYVLFALIIIIYAWGLECCIFLFFFSHTGWNVKPKRKTKNRQFEFNRIRVAIVRRPRGKQSVIGRKVLTNRSFLCLYYTTAAHFCQKKKKTPRKEGKNIKGEQWKHYHHIFSINGRPFPS